MFALLLAFAFAVLGQQPQPSAFDAEVSDVLAAVGDAARGSLWIGTPELETHLLWSTPEPATAPGVAVFGREASESRLSARALAELVAPRLGTEAGKSEFLSSGQHPLLGTQRRAYGLFLDRSPLAAYQVGSWKHGGTELVYVALIEFQASASAEELEHARKTIAYQTGQLADVGMTSVRRTQGASPAVLEERGDFVPTALDVPLLPALIGRSARTNNSRLFLLAAVDPRKGSVVADIGCGNGTDAQFIFQALGPKGRMVLRDANAQVITNIRGKAQDRFEIGKCERDDVAIDAETLDCAYLRQVWGIVSHQDTRGTFLASLFRALKPGGEVVVLQYLNTGGDPLGFTRSLLKEWSAAGFECGRRWKVYGRERDGGSSVLVYEFRRPKR